MHLRLIQGGGRASHSDPDRGSLALTVLDVVRTDADPATLPERDLARLRDAVREFALELDGYLAGRSIDAHLRWCLRCGEEPITHDAPQCAVCDAREAPHA